MIKFIGKRLWYGFLVIIGVVLVVFFLFHALPGDPVSMMVGQRTDVSTREAITKELGLDQPLPKQLFYYVSDLSPISIHEDTEENQAKYEYTPVVDFGKDVLVVKRPYLRRSFQTNKRVDEILWKNIENTFWLALAAMLFASVFGISFGIIAALKQNSFWDHFLVSSSVLGISVPSFVSGIVIAMVFGYYLSD